MMGRHPVALLSTHETAVNAIEGVSGFYKDGTKRDLVSCKPTSV